MKIFSLLAVLLGITFIVAAPLTNDVERRLANISKQLDQLELQFNQSISHLLNRIDDNSHAVIQLIRESFPSNAHRKLRVSLSLSV